MRIHEPGTRGMPRGYRVYRDGTVTSSKSGHERPLMICIGKRGYPVVCLRDDNGKRLSRCVHRLLALNFIANPDQKREVNHLDGDKTNNALSNLEWCTPSENQLHAHRTGLQPRSTPKLLAHRIACGDRMIRARRRFSTAQIVSIKKRRASGESFRSIARSLGCDHTILSDICAGRSYRRVVP